MAIAAISPLKAAMVSAGYDIPHRSDLQEGALQTYLGGALLQASSGNLIECTGAGGTGTANAVVGVSENPGQNLAVAGFYQGGTTVNGVLVPVVGAPNQGPLYIPSFPTVVIFEANLATTTALDPDTVTSLAITQIMTTAAISKASTSKLWYLDLTAAGNKKALIIGLKDPVGTVSGRVYFMFLGTAGVTIYA
jgi:hypothetical protein